MSIRLPMFSSGYCVLMQAEAADSRTRSAVHTYEDDEWEDNVCASGLGSKLAYMYKRKRGVYSGVHNIFVILHLFTRIIVSYTELLYNGLNGGQNVLIGQRRSAKCMSVIRRSFANWKKMSSIEDRGQTDCIILLPRPYALDIDL